MLNVMFLGSSNVGKTTILQSYINHKFYDKSSSTIGIEKVSTKISDSSDLLINVYYNNNLQKHYNPYCTCFSYI